MTDDVYSLEELDESERLVLSDLINRVLDKGVVISADLTISIANVDLIQLDLKVLISSVATLRRRAEHKRDRLSLRPGPRA
jgi:hypothetical protein